MTPIEEAIGYTFKNPALLTRALTRFAYAREQGLAEEMHMDGLCVLGDAAFDLAIVEGILEAGAHDKGVITKKKIHSVNMLRLRRHAELIGLAESVRWGKGEEAQEIWQSGRVLAECFEALIGALYLDSGMPAVKRLINTKTFEENKKD
ncbi:MAG: ribonuclease III family protein [Methanocalculus sp. MSAO_Arc1]|uniref:ribonuclease III domain-containing protein n=1 Tax=Methanocalculus TaxID=71151 RepID=UPI000FF47FC0|nr:MULTISPECIES: ribonuclease III domain-containing protein [unclassified Methanocalculus]MCP1661896.1 ribonuclease-3 [Methanocalculus sp. AMF5]RQD81217.1 MAG: ribonuclease III family protein [Methanocalculus sp. MSAO_Arc1]